MYFYMYFIYFFVFIQLLKCIVLYMIVSVGNLRLCNLVLFRGIIGTFVYVLLHFHDYQLIILMFLSTSGFKKYFIT